MLVKKIKDNKYSNYIIIIIIIILLFFIYKFFDVNFIGSLFNTDLNKISLYSILLLFILRSTSIIIPVLPGTYCSVISGYLYGVKNGLLLIFFADFLACFCSFFIARKFGRNFVGRFLGQRQLKKVENISKKYIENNFFLMTGFLLTSWFDFVCYAVGLTKISWKKFMPALILSIIISDIPFVAAGHALNALNDVNLQKILNGEVKIVFGNYLILLIISAFLIFGLGFLNIFLKKQRKEL